MGFFDSLKRGLERSREALNEVFYFGGEVDEDFWEDLEDRLVMGDMGGEVAMRVADDLRDLAARKNLTRADQLKGALAERLAAEFCAAERDPFEDTPSCVLFVGINGAGKTTTVGKLAGRAVSEGKKVVIGGADTFRAAAIEQLQVWGERAGVDVITRERGADPASVCYDVVDEAERRGCDLTLIDTAGRLHTSADLMRELAKVVNVTRKRYSAPVAVVLVVDATTGQNGLNQAREFNAALDLDGLIVPKLDGDARGGGALSVREVTGKPIKFVSMGEKPDSLEVFHPDRMAKRILGMGDVVGIIEEAQKLADEQQVADAERMLREGFTMDDLLTQMQQIRKMGGLQKLAGMIPGLERAVAQQGGAGFDESQMVRMEAMIRSMTKEERAKPKMINGQRRRRIAEGSGRSVQEVNQLIKKWSEMNKMMGKMRTMTQGMTGKKGKKNRRAMQSMMRDMGLGNMR